VENLPVAACKGKGAGRWKKAASEDHEINGEVVEIGSDVLHVKKEGIVSVLDEWDSFQPSDVKDVYSTTAPWSCGLIEFIFVAEVSEAALCVPALRVK
jgi:hypothetical protein